LKDSSKKIKFGEIAPCARETAQNVLSGALTVLLPYVFSTASACVAECDGVFTTSAARESVAADHAFRLVLDASPDGLSVLVGQRLPRCEQQRVLPSGRMEPRLLWREQPQHSHVCGLRVAPNI